MTSPLADKIRPATLEEFVGQEHILGRGKPLRKMIEDGKIVSMILWGPPGTGKTTLIRLLSKYINARFLTLSAVNSGKADIMRVMKEAKEYQQAMDRSTILFIDEIHRFNKAQQDALLPYVENGTIVFCAATTENPSFEINSPLLSRSRVFKFTPLEDDDIKIVVDRAIKEYPKHKFEDKALQAIIKLANGDARTAINAVELAATMSKKVTYKLVSEAMQKKNILYDKNADNHYDTISAFIKSMRGSDPDAALHYLARMIKAGEDPVFIARRMVIFASEDIGNIRPNALVLAVACMQAVHMIGMPEAQLVMAQTVTYLATCPKSIASTEALWGALRDIDEENLGAIPLHLRNAPTRLMSEFGYAKGHVRYPWKVEKETGKKINQQYLPDNLKGKKYYKPDWNRIS
jgi:putative ATPase